MSRRGYSKASRQGKSQTGRGGRRAAKRPAADIQLPLCREELVDLLSHAAAALGAGGEVLVIYWRHGVTPRGPALDIRPRPEQVVTWAAEADLLPIGEAIDLPPWHYGLRMRLR
jgi:hypothetical protein